MASYHNSFVSSKKDNFFNTPDTDDYSQLANKLKSHMTKTKKREILLKDIAAEIRVKS